MSCLTEFVERISRMDTRYAPNDPRNMTNLINEARRLMSEEDKAQRIELKFDPKTFVSLRSAIQVRLLSHGELSGLADIFLARLIESVDEGVPSWLVKQKKEIKS